MIGTASDTLTRAKRLERKAERADVLLTAIATHLGVDVPLLADGEDE
ncbi:hypothetical protein [Actinocorallia aurantiaca]|uniref:Uncharacterized protein n=1 Tax=Actinocorallia aurantiaca TaxID=46204 RepID=A0ABN3UEW7_9ACTN